MVVSLRHRLSHWSSSNQTVNMGQSRLERRTVINSLSNATEGKLKKIIISIFVKRHKVVTSETLSRLVYRIVVFLQFDELTSFFMCVSVRLE